MQTNSCEIKKKESVLLHQFGSLSSQEKYIAIMDWGKKLPSFPQDACIKDNQVMGCQSRTFILVEGNKERVFFLAQSDALISAGLAAMLLFVYNDFPPGVILTHSPSFIEQLQLQQSLTLGRMNGLANMYCYMQKKTVSLLQKSA